MADQGMGFLRMAAKGPQGDIDPLESDGPELTPEVATIGQMGMGKVINGIDSVTEAQIYQQLDAVYGEADSKRPGYADIFAIIVTFSALVAAFFEQNAVKAAAFVGVASAAIVPYITTRK